MQQTICFFQGYYLPYLGGVERYTYNIAKRLIAKGYRVIVVASQHDESLPFKEEVEGILVYRLPSRNFWKQRYPFIKKNKNYQELLEEIRQEKIDLFVANTRFQLPALLGVQLAKEAGKEAIVIEHGTTYLTLNNPVIDSILNAMERHLIKRVKKSTSQFYGVSKEATDWLATFGVKGSGVLYNAIDGEKIATIPIKKSDDKIIISYAGRLQAQIKGVELLLKVFTKLETNHQNIELHIAGDGPIYQDLSEHYRSENIIFHGKLEHDEVLKLDAQSDIFVLMSKIEGFSTALLEAGALQNVLISSKVGGVREMIPSADYGFVIDNDEASLLKALESSLADKEKMRSMQAKIAEHIRSHFTWEKTADRFVELIQEKLK